MRHLPPNKHAISTSRGSRGIAYRTPGGSHEVTILRVVLVLEGQRGREYGGHVHAQNPSGP